MAWFSSEGDGLDLYDGKLLAVPLLALVSLALLLLEYDHLVTALVLQNLGRDRGAREVGLADPEIRALSSRQDFLNLNGGAGFRVGEAVHDEDVPLGNGELLSLGFDRGFHQIKRSISRFETAKARLFWREIVDQRGRAGPEAEADLEAHRKAALVVRLDPDPDGRAVLEHA